MESLIGVRPAEVAGQRWDQDVDLLKGTVSVLNTRTMVRNHYVVEKATKTKKLQGAPGPRVLGGR
ncbi:hypothetical protein [Streptomyces neyagawaensis]|uniref:Transposase n=1 Tax=Streptomyces neyagawaensis TaxID=42238 RepID=A0ABV3AZA0_9ACTN